MDTKSAEQQLNRLLTRNYDAEEGYKTVATKVAHPEMRDFFTHNSKERNSFGHEIKNIMSEMNIKAEKGTSISGDIHRAWINVRDVLSANSDEAILAEAERGEDFAIEDYKEAVENAAISPDNRRKLSDHLNSIKNSKDQITKLKATLK